MVRLRLAAALAAFASACNGPARPVSTVAGPPVPGTNSFTGADCERYVGRLVTFRGTVSETGGIEELYTVRLLDVGKNGRRWHALVSREVWARLKRG